MTSLHAEPGSSVAKWAPQVIVLLDEETRVLNINRSLAGTGFTTLKVDTQDTLHEQLHPGCNGNCRFSELWKKAWISLATRDNIEWEVNDLRLGQLLRLNLARPPTSRDVATDRRRQHALLTITDITKHRRKYESLVKRERALVKLLLEQGVNIGSSANDDEGGKQHDEVHLRVEYGQKYRSLSRQVIMAQELERKRIASELHDSVAQSLGVIKYHIEANVERLSGSDQDLDLDAFETVIDHIRDLVEEVRRISGNLTPSMLQDFGLCVALEWLCNEFRSDSCELQPQCNACADESDLPDIVKIGAYRVAQEALNNVSKHSSATEVTVSLSMVDGGLQLEIKDNGVGMDLSGAADVSDGSGSLGMRNMRERVLATGGEFALGSAPGQGVTISATWSQDDLALLSDESVLDGVHGHS